MSAGPGTTTDMCPSTAAALLPEPNCANQEAPVAETFTDQDQTADHVSLLKLGGLALPGVPSRAAEATAPEGNSESSSSSIRVAIGLLCTADQELSQEALDSQHASSSGTTPGVISDPTLPFEPNSALVPLAAPTAVVLDPGCPPPLPQVSILPGVASRHDVQIPKNGLILGLPGIMNRQEIKDNVAPKLEAPIQYVTDSVTTPASKAARLVGTKPHQEPVPLRSIASSITSIDYADQGVGPSTSDGARPSGCKLPKWARQTDRMGLNTANASGPAVTTNAGGSMHGIADAPITSGASSLTSSLNSMTWQGVIKYDSSSSFKWVPENVVVQSWHRKLSDTYRDYNMVNIVGEGRNGAVFIVQHRKSERYYACKLLNKGDHNPNTLRSEIEMLRKLSHPNIVRLYETNEDKEAVFLLMELCQGGDLFGRIMDEGFLSERVAKIFARQMLDALAYCHAMGVVHRDVKPENFLLETEDPGCLTLKLADFGIATNMRLPMRDDTDGALVNGSYPYMAPELLTRQWHSLVRESKGSREVLGAGDLWSCGIVIYVMLSGDLPFGDNVEAICSGEPPDFSSEVWHNVSPEAIDLILKLLNPDTSARLTAAQALKHEWFSKASGTQSDDEEVTMRNWHTEGSESVGTSLDSRYELARQTLRLLRRWRRQPKLRRIAIAAVAKRLEADHPSLRFAQAVYRSFCRSGDKLRCELLVQALNSALCDHAMPNLSASSGGEALSEPEPPVVHSNSCAQLSSLDSIDTDASDRSGEHSITGFQLRQRMKCVMRRLARVLEDTPKDSSTDRTPCIGSESEELVSLTELKILVDALDGVKNGIVDYTLLVASMLPPTVYGDETRVSEIFEQFDIRKRGAVSPEDLQAALRVGVGSRATSQRRFVELVAKFDLNGDGVLDLDEFRSMLRGAVLDGEGVDFTITPMTEPTSACTSRASPAGPAQTPTPTPTPGARRSATMSTSPQSTSLSKALFASPAGAYPSR